MRTSLIYKRKRPAGDDSAHMQPPLSHLMTSAADLQLVFFDQSSWGLSSRADMVHAGNSCGSPVHIQRWRPMTASDCLLEISRTSEHFCPSKKKKIDSNTLNDGVCVEAVDFPSELQGSEHHGSWTNNMQSLVESRERKQNSAEIRVDDFASEPQTTNQTSADNKPHTAVSRPSSSVPSLLQERPKLTQKPTPSEPIVLSSEEEEDDEEKGGQETFTVKDSLLKKMKVQTHHSQQETCSRTEQTKVGSFALQQLPHRLIQYPAVPCKGRITVTKDDLARLDAGVYLNDVIIDFYLKYLLEGIGGAVAKRSHVFSSFFYSQLSRQRAASEDSAPFVSDRHMRHQRVKTWTRKIDIFSKDFLFVPVNQSAHWYLVVICFPGLEEVQHEARHRPTDGAERAREKPAVTQTSQQPPERPERGCQKDTVMKRPCFLVMDSLNLSSHEDVCQHLRDYLQVEWEVQRGRSRLFTQASMETISCRVPQQDNSTDCGLYLLQYVESFLQDPVVHFDVPVCLESWFPRQQMRQKREEIRSLILKMHQDQKQEADTQPP